MNIIQAAILGIVQGLTEFLPVSSSGHLAAGGQLLGIAAAGDIGFEVAVHTGTLLAVLVYFRLRISHILTDAVHGGRDGRRWVLYLAIGTLPAGVFGLAMKDSIELLFNNITLVGVAWIVTALILLIGEKTATDRLKVGQMGAWRALLVGFAQALALVPGISRSGSTIATGLMTGMERRSSVDFAFLLSLPAVGGATLLTSVDWVRGSIEFGTYHIVGGLTAFLAGYWAIAVMLKVVTTGRLTWFAVYCAVAGTTAILFGILA